VTSARISDVDLASRVARLTAGQRECLDLVDDHATSKEIARQLGISRHTVDARLRGAIQTLGVTSRREAAIIYRAAMQAEAYQPFAYQSPRIVPGLRLAERSGHDDSDDIADAAPGQAAGAPFAPGVLPAAGGRPLQLHAGQSAAVGLQSRQEASVVSDSAVWTAAIPVEPVGHRSSLRLWGGANDLSAAQRMAGILVVTILAMLAFGIFLTGIEALTLLRS
jgi:DNA-binding CsgD family transcriptional regulator